MFTGEYTCNIDSKSRIMLPAKFREKLVNKVFWITKGLQGQIDIYDEESWKVVINKMNNFKQSDKNQMLLKRHIVGSSQEVMLDSQGRITITPSLKNFANLLKKCVVIGMVERIEIWDEGILNNIRKDENIEEILESLEIDF